MGQHALFMASNLVNVKFSWVVPIVKCRLTKYKNYQDVVMCLHYICAIQSQMTKDVFYKPKIET